MSILSLWAITHEKSENSSSHVEEDDSSCSVSAESISLSGGRVQAKGLLPPTIWSQGRLAGRDASP